MVLLVYYQQGNTRRFNESNATKERRDNKRYGNFPSFLTQAQGLYFG